MGFGIKLGGSKSKSSTSPWGPQQKYLKDVWSNAQNLFDRGSYPGDWGVDPNDNQYDAIKYGTGVAGQAQGIGDSYTQSGNMLSGGLGSAFGYYNDQLDGGAYSDPSEINDYAYQFMDNPNTDAQITAALRDPYRNLSEQQLPAIAQAAAATGNSGSSRRAVVDSIAMRGYEDRAADVSANIYGQNLDRGYSMYGMNAGRNDMAANNLASMGAEGLGYLGAGFDFYNAQPELLAQWGDYQQGIEQDDVNADIAQWQSPWDLLGMYSGAVQAGSWGGTTKGKSSGWGIAGGKE